MSANGNGHGWTTIQGRIMNLLSDGKPHHREELRDCLQDKEASHRAVSIHLFRIRRVLRPYGQDIICECIRRQIWYRHVKLIHSTTQ